MSLERWALVYLLVPVLLLVAGLYKLPIALPALVLLLLAGLRVFRQTESKVERLSWTVWLPVLLLSLVWTLLAGYWGGVPMNSDWYVRLSLLRDLSLGGWPLRYPVENGEPLLLRAPLAYYLPAAVFGRIFGPGGAFAVLALWTLIGLQLMILLVLRATSSLANPIRAIAVSLVLLLAGGLDLLGWLLTYQAWPAWGQHIEWWATHFQYSGTTTGLFWVPNHALPAWLVISILWSRRDEGIKPVFGFCLLVLTLAWSPLTFLGCVPFVIWTVARQRLSFSALREPELWSWILVLGLLWSYLSWDSASVPPSFPLVESANQGALVAWIFEWLLFSLLEWGWLAVLLITLVKRHEGLWLAIALLLLLPLIRLGPGNDWVMRVGQPALCWIFLTAVQAWPLKVASRIGNTALFWLAGLGAAGAIQELSAARLSAPTRVAGSESLDRASARAAHYLAPLPPPGTLLHDLLRPANSVPEGVDLQPTGGVRETFERR